MPYIDGYNACTHKDTQHLHATLFPWMVLRSLARKQEQPQLTLHTMCM